MIKLDIVSYDHTTYFGEVCLSDLTKISLKFRDIQFFNFQDQVCYASFNFSNHIYVVKTHTCDGRIIENKFSYLDDLKNYIKRNYKK